MSTAVEVNVESGMFSLYACRHSDYHTLVMSDAYNAIIFITVVHSGNRWKSWC